MPGSLRTYDVFDTLIARRSVEPSRVLAKLEVRAGVPGLAAARGAADRRLGGGGQPYGLQHLWNEVAAALGLGEAEATQLQELEIQIEHEESIPIVENLALVRDGDLLVSDTYLPAEVVRSLLSQAGLRQQVGLVITNDGKHRGWIWPLLLARFHIAQHFGDNVHSDGATPSAAGIPSIIYTGAARSSVERLLAEQGWEPLADLIREVRLANPFPESRGAERTLWSLACQLNFPLLYFGSLWLENSAPKGRELLFVSRDCLLWQALHRRLFPDRPAAYLFTSRLCLLNPTEGYLSYFSSAWRPDSLIVDLFSTGASWSAFFARLGVRASCRFFGFVDNYRYLPEAPTDRLDAEAVFRTSEFGAPLGKGVEMLNYAPHPVVEDVLPLPGGGALPLLADRLEYDAALPEAAHQAFRACIEALPHYPHLRRTANANGNDLIKLFIRLICADARLAAIYPGHEAADADYLRRLRA